MQEGLGYIKNYDLFAASRPSALLRPDGGCLTDGAQHFAAANKEYFTCPSNASLQTGDIDFEVGAWVWLDSTNAAGVCGKYTTGGGIEYLLWVNNRVPRMRVSVDGTTSTEVVSSVTIPLNTWCFLQAGYNTATDTLYIQVNNTTVNTTDHLGGVFVDDAPFRVGAFASGVNITGFWDGRIGPIYLSTCISTPAESSWLHNDGKGRTSSEILSEPIMADFCAGLVSWWDMDEDGVQHDRVGDNDLQPASVPIVNETTLNGDFESGLSGWAIDPVGGGGRGVVTDDTIEAHSGTHSVKVVTTSTGGSGIGISKASTIIIGKRYQASYWAKTASGTATVKSSGSTSPFDNNPYPVASEWSQNTYNFTAMSTLFGVYAATANTTVYIDQIALQSLGPTPVVGLSQRIAVASDPIAKIIDASINLSHFTQETYAKRPIYDATGINGHPAMLFDGWDDSLYRLGDLIGVGDLSIVSVVKTITWAGGLCRLVTNGKFYINAVNGVVYVSSSGVNEASSYSNTLSLNTPCILIITRTSTGITNIYVNAALSSAANQSSGTPAVGGDTYVGNTSAGNRGFNGCLGDVMIVPKVLPQAHITAMTSILRAKYGI